jgi:hypothetical protein
MAQLLRAALVASASSLFTNSAEHSDMENYALIENEKVINVIVWDGSPFVPGIDEIPAEYDENGNETKPAVPAVPAQGWQVPEGCAAVVIPQGSPVSIGYLYDGSNFTAPASTTPDRTPAEILAFNTGRKNNLSAVATAQIAVLTDATDPDIVDAVDPADVAALKAWKVYRVALSKVDLTQAAPVWPSAPA